jgi:hypothetical protein
MSVLFPEKISTNFYQSQEMIARAYLDHFCAYLRASEDITDYFGQRNGMAFTSEGGTRLDEFKYKYSGNAVAIDFDLFDESHLELIKDISVYAFLVQCQSTEGNITEFLFEFEADDETFLSVLPEKVREHFENGEFEVDLDNLLLD